MVKPTQHRRTVVGRRPRRPIGDVTVTTTRPEVPTTSQDFMLAMGEAHRRFREAFDAYSELLRQQAQQVDKGYLRKVKGIDEADEKWKEAERLALYVMRSHFDRTEGRQDAPGAAKLRELALAGAKWQKEWGEGSPTEALGYMLVTAMNRVDTLRDRQGDCLSAGRKVGPALRKETAAAARDLRLALAEVQDHANGLFDPIVIVDLGRQMEARVKEFARASPRRWKAMMEPVKRAKMAEKGVPGRS